MSTTSTISASPPRRVSPSSPPPPRHQRPSPFKKLLFGAPYYPEHWTPAERRDDPERMAAAGVNVVRLAEFAWDRMEPRRGEFDFSLFAETIERLGEHGIDAILCTPTATPPRWLTSGHEEWMRVDANGRRMTHGSRQHCCTTNPEFRAESRRITRAMADFFAENPRVIGWQTDNEFYCHFSECHCAACEAGFREWLRMKYGGVAELNHAWGTAFWAHTYDDFEQIDLPRLDRPTYPNPGAALDYARFLSDSVREFQREQVEILRAAQPRWWITHNGIFAHMDLWKFTEDLDLLGIDVYPGFACGEGADFLWAAMQCERCRAASGNFIVPEQQGGAGGQRTYLHATPAPGQMRLWAWQSIAHGADGVLHFRWRTCRFGAEIYWNGILDHDNVPRRRYREFAQEGAEIARLGDLILGTVPLVRAAVLVESEQDEAHETMALGLPSPNDQRKLAYGQMAERHLPAGFVDAADSFEGLELVFVPSFALVDEAFAEKLRAFVRGGGTVVATARTATRDRNNQVPRETPPGQLRDLFGITIEEFGKLTSPELKLSAPGHEIPAGAGYEILAPHEAEVLAEWSAPAGSPPHAAPGEAAITLRREGRGAAIYLGTYLSEENAAALFDLVLGVRPVEPLASAPACVEITCRRSAERSLLFVLNHDGVAQRVTLPAGGRDLLTDEPAGPEFSLPAYGVALVEARPRAQGKAGHSAAGAARFRRV